MVYAFHDYLQYSNVIFNCSDIKRKKQTVLASSPLPGQLCIVKTKKIEDGNKKTT